ncbi:indolepyruvate oxidoreductase subunit beta family protein [Sulfitobacter sp. F26204]|uniref:indolepyruvate oxidoreductase subunit beta family protein n=1 Tax=Sulfitobacter sp. F26204 TaxID=2996014 RepID=UPI00225E3C72|nr:indolepyruvate oxidoreductase subunit beta family protein [Sulfitobacter sp. F26204]MCX7561624.1 indolepyruvate oxidoreductase subunit beta family protein [Sulfitobacter sp. F26204]
MNCPLSRNGPELRDRQIIKLAIMAVGGQGGGVLIGWIESLARAQGFVCQATSVAGVSQRTGATIYYIEMMAAAEKQPVFALAPSAGDVDILIAAEMMEVGRAIMRGFVTPDRTLLIGSSHRALAVSEKAAPGDGIADAGEVVAAAEIAAQRFILADMDRLATAHGSVISASLFGALAGSGGLPFSRGAFEEAIRSGGKGVEASLRAFAAGYDVAEMGGTETDTAPEAPAQVIVGPQAQMTLWTALQMRVKELPEPVQQMALPGLVKVVDFQDCAYGAQYLERLEKVVARDTATQNWSLGIAGAKYIARAMTYDDIIRVADLKTRAPRLKRIREEMGAKDTNLVELTEFFHPRAEEIASLMPARMGARWEASPKRMALLNRMFKKGRRLRSHTLPSFLVLYFLSSLKGFRMKTRRHAVELAHLERWLTDSLALTKEDYGLAVEMLKNRRLIKGYSDTHARGLSKFAKVSGAVEMLRGRRDAADWMRRLREAALQDPEGKALDGALDTVRSFV